VEEVERGCGLDCSGSLEQVAVSCEHGSQPWVHKTRFVSGLGEELVAFQEGLRCVELSVVVHRQAKTLRVLNYMVIWIVFKHCAPLQNEIWCSR